MIKFIIKLVSFFNGKKTAIAALYWAIINEVLPVWFPSGVPDNIERILSTIGVLLTVAGVGHKLKKSRFGRG